MNDNELIGLLSRKASVQIHIRATTFNYAAWTSALSSNGTLEDVVLSIYVPTLGTTPLVLDFFRAIGKLSNLNSLRINGMTFCRIPLSILSTILLGPIIHEHLSVVHVQDVEFRIGEDNSEIEVLVKATANLPQLQQFTLAHCRLSSETSNSVLDPLVGTLLTKKGMECIIISASRIHSLGGCVTKNTLRDIFRAKNQYTPSALEELRLLKFGFTEDVLTSLFGTLLALHTSLRKLLLSSCQWDLLSLRILSHYIRNSPNLRHLQLLGNCEYLEMKKEGHVELVAALQASRHLQFFYLEPMNRSEIFRLEEEDGGIPFVSQQTYTEMLKTNCVLEEFRMLRMFPPELQSEVEFYLRLNRAGRRHLCFAESNEGINDGNDEKNFNLRDCRAAWIDAITNVNDDVACIFYFLLLNPSLCHVKVT